MIIRSDWHIHSESSYDATLSLEEIVQSAKALGFVRIGIADHVNFNDAKFLGDLKNSAESVKTMQKISPELVLGVELTPIEKPEFDYIAKHGTREGYTAPISVEPFEIELALTKEELMRYGVRYAVGAAHWRVDVPNGRSLPADPDAMIREWYRQQMWLAADERVTILGHPWWSEKRIWYEDFSVIPHSMHMDIASVLKEKKKFVECNEKVLCSPKASEKFRNQYAEFIRELFEMGIPVTYGSDSHKEYGVLHCEAEKLLRSVGFVEGEIATLGEKDFW